MKRMNVQRRKALAHDVDTTKRLPLVTAETLLEVLKTKGLGVERVWCANMPTLECVGCGTLAFNHGQVPASYCEEFIQHTLEDTIWCIQFSVETGAPEALDCAMFTSCFVRALVGERCEVYFVYADDVERKND